MNTPNAMGYQQPNVINVVLLPNMKDIDNYPVNPGTSVMFLDSAMSEFRMRSRDTNGFPNPERSWTLTETTPPQTAMNGGDYATKKEIDELRGMLAEIKNALLT